MPITSDQIVSLLKRLVVAQESRSIGAFERTAPVAKITAPMARMTVM
jgi:hypothetical protein